VVGERRAEVFLLHPDIDHYQWLEADWDQPGPAPVFDGRSLLQGWHAPSVQVREPDRTRPRLWWLYDTALFAADESTLGALGIDEHDGWSELLALDAVSTEPLWLINVLGTADYLDMERTAWRRGIPGSMIERPYFDLARFQEPSLFRLSIDWRVNLYAWRRSGEESIVDRISPLSHHGLLFDRVWDSQRGGSKPWYLPRSPTDDDPFE
jgi:hypothetical protein